MTIVARNVTGVAWIEAEKQSARIAEVKKFIQSKSLTNGKTIMSRYGNSQEDQWKESLFDSHYDMEDEDEQEELSCEWCHVKYFKEDSGAREPELYCSPVCRSLHYQWSEVEEND